MDTTNSAGGGVGVRFLAARLVELEIVGTIRHEAVRQTL